MGACGVGIVVALEAANVPVENEEDVTHLGSSNIKYVNFDTDDF